MKKIVAFLLVLAMAVTAVANTGVVDKAGNSDATLAVFKPHPQVAPLQLDSYMDSQIYFPPTVVDLYVGANAGGSFVDFGHKTSNDNKPQAYGPTAGAYVGIGRRVADELYVGAELYGYLAKLSYRTSIGGGEIEMHQGNSGGLDILFGGYAANSRLYLRAGALIGSFNLHSSNTSATGVDSFSTHPLGLHVGLGADIYITRLLSIRPEFDFTSYQKFTRRNGSTKNDFAPIVYSITIGATFHFANTLPPT